MVIIVNKINPSMSIQNKRMDESILVIMLILQSPS